MRSDDFDFPLKIWTEFSYTSKRTTYKSPFDVNLNAESNFSHSNVFVLIEKKIQYGIYLNKRNTLKLKSKNTAEYEKWIGEQIKKKIKGLPIF